MTLTTSFPNFQVSRAEEEKRLAQKKKEEEERRVREIEEKKQRDIEEKRQRLEEAEKKRQAMVQAMKESSKTGPNFTIQKKSDNVSMPLNIYQQHTTVVMLCIFVKL